MTNEQKLDAIKEYLRINKEVKFENLTYEDYANNTRNIEKIYQGKFEDYFFANTTSDINCVSITCLDILQKNAIDKIYNIIKN